MAAMGAEIALAQGCASYASPIGPELPELADASRGGDGGRDARAGDASHATPTDAATDARHAGPPDEPADGSGTCVNIDGTFTIECDSDSACAVVPPHDAKPYGGDKSPRMQCASGKYKTEQCGAFWCGVGCVCENPDERLCRCADDHQQYEPRD
ncbi:hypothetical protein AKJ09_09371 [Labilithrix luteola]|uniref:Uncharacterized protein n=1 Tax=Labilithrix luteola TaxID=1391654 RepID=A0A0K1QAG2_9BACT|nr:hypothetical protein AKJ09_09371 [Labilithrix luteola]